MGEAQPLSVAGMVRNTRRNWFLGEHVPEKKSGVVDGLLHPGSWMLPQKAGGIASRNNAVLAVATTASGAMGVNIEGSTSFVLDFAPAAGQLIVSGTGSASLVLTASGTALAILDGAGSASFSVTPSATIGAIAFGTGLATASVTCSLTPYAIGNMEGSTVDSSVLTLDGIAGAVWTRVIEAGYNAEQIVRLLAAHAAGAATGLEGANPQFTGLDGSTVRIDGTYSAGTRTIDALDVD